MCCIALCTTDECKDQDAALVFLVCQLSFQSVIVDSLAIDTSPYFCDRFRPSFSS
jgi:hypothetical protein